MSLAPLTLNTTATDWDQIGRTVRRRRRDLDLSESGAARRAGLPKQIWRDLEDGYGASLSAAALEQADEVLGLHLSSLIAPPLPSEADIDARQELESRLAAAEARAREADTRAAEATLALRKARAARTTAEKRATEAEATAGAARAAVKAAEKNAAQAEAATGEARRQAKAKANAKAPQPLPAPKPTPPARAKAPQPPAKTPQRPAAPPRKAGPSGASKA